jgi:hypothetical protein
MQNGHVESFHGRLREECLRASWFTNLFDARSKTSDWRKEYNDVRPHSSLDYRTPAEFAHICGAKSYGKGAGYACLENAAGVSTLPQLRRRDKFVFTNVRNLGAGHADAKITSMFIWTNEASDGGYSSRCLCISLEMDTDGNLKPQRQNANYQTSSWLRLAFAISRSIPLFPEK